MTDIIRAMQTTPIWLQIIFWSSWLGVAAALPIAFVKALNNWPVFCSIYFVLLIVCLPQLLKF